MPINQTNYSNYEMLQDVASTKNESPSLKEDMFETT